MEIVVGSLSQLEKIQNLILRKTKLTGICASLLKGIIDLEVKSITHNRLAANSIAELAVFLSLLY